MPKLKKAAPKAKRESAERLFDEPEEETAPEFEDDPLARPLADRVRPRTLDEFRGQEKLVGPGRALRRMIEEDRLQSLIFWGPPGTGKTTLASLIAQRTAARFVTFSAVSSGIREVREVMAEADEFRLETGRRTVVFIDEIHRFNKAQQDAFLPYVESGTIILIGATTENPSFEVNSALLSRSKVFVLEMLTAEHLLEIMKHALEDPERGLGREQVIASDDALNRIAVYASGDARAALNTLELAVAIAEADASGARVLTKEVLSEAMQRAAIRYDKAGEEHYNIISAFIKSIRNSDPDAAVYWLARMIEAGEDPMFVARRLVIHASRRHRAGRSDGFNAGSRSYAGDASGRAAGSQTGFDASDALPGARPEIKHRSINLHAGAARCSGVGARACADALAQCRNFADEAIRLRRRLPIRS